MYFILKMIVNSMHDIIPNVSNVNEILNKIKLKLTIRCPVLCMEISQSPYVLKTYFTVNIYDNINNATLKVHEAEPWKFSNPPKGHIEREIL